MPGQEDQVPVNEITTCHVLQHGPGIPGSHLTALHEA